MASATHPQQMQPLLELEEDLHDALVVVQARHDETVARMDSSRRLIETLLENEAKETQLYVDDTTLEMRAIREVVQLEMENARREVERLLREAAVNITNVRTQRATTLDELARKTKELETQRLLQKKHAEEEIARAQWQTEAEERRLWGEIKGSEGAGQGMEVVRRPQTGVDPSTALAGGSQDGYDLWGWPFIVCLVLGACVAVFLINNGARREKEERRRRVLYSEQLRHHFADDRDSTTTKTPTRAPSPDVADETDAVTPDTARAPRRRPTLHRRARQGWSPAASTASTVSSPDESSVLGDSARSDTTALS